MDWPNEIDIPGGIGNNHNDGAKRIKQVNKSTSKHSTNASAVSWPWQSHECNRRKRVREGIQERREVPSKTAGCFSDIGTLANVWYVCYGDEKPQDDL